MPDWLLLYQEWFAFVCGPLIVMGLYFLLAGGIVFALLASLGSSFLRGGDFLP